VQKGNFLTGGKSILWKGNGGFLPICRSCCEILLASLTEFYSDNEEHALKHMCAMFDWYYSEMTSALALASMNAGSSKIAIYSSKIGARQVGLLGESYLDTIRDDVRAQEAIRSIDQASEESSSDDDEFVVTRDMVRTWGAGFTPEQYRYLEEEFADWTSKNVCNTKSQEEIYRNIALAQLDIRIAREKGAKVNEAQRALQELMNSANILPKQNADNVLADTQTFGTLLKKYEETDPIPEPSPEWKDVDGIRTYMNTWFRGGLAKALKIKNENTALYDEAVEEMERYTVRPAAGGVAESANDASIFDQHDGEGGGGDE
jgi:hypothetical protein